MDTSGKKDIADKKKSLVVPVIIAVLLFNPVSLRFISLQVTLLRIDAEAARKGINENYVIAEYIVFSDGERLEKLKVHINNYEDQMLVREALSHCNYIYGTVIFKPARFRKSLNIGNHEIDITSPTYGIGSFYYTLGQEHLDKLNKLFSSIPGYIDF